MSENEVEFRNYVEEILDGLSEVPGREVVVFGERRIGADEFRSTVYRLARALRRLGVEPGRTVTLLCGNLPETIAARYAVNLLGVQYNHLYNRLAAEVQAKMIADVDTSVLIVDPALAGRARELLERVPVERVLLLGPVPEEAPAGSVDLLALAAGESAEPVPSPARPEDLCFIRHSGGTTGHPKGIRSTFGRMSGLGLFHDPDGPAAPRDLLATPLSHAGGFLADNALATGGTVVLHYGFEPGEILATIERERITRMFLLPPLLYQVVDHPGGERFDTSSLRTVTYGGTPSSPTRIARALRRLGPVLQQGYGQFEAGGISLLPPADHDPDRLDVLRTAGRVAPGVEVEIRDPDGKALPTGEVGEICVLTAQPMEGYWKDPELTARVLRDGWIHTGDLGSFDEDGRLTVVDRIKDMIAVVGGHVYTTELEEFLAGHPEVRDSAVYGVRDADGGYERIHVTVVLAPGAATTADELRELIAEGRGPMYVPDRIEFVDRLPLTDAGKPDKKLLRLRADA
ncbi:AMP-binding protein [Streptomyces sp. BI20]|uniref:AMP-binding protein n=1 Tax=Streptomyces sp. BI20 TaxID=3403460 RepID=UPI003C786FF5